MRMRFDRSTMLMLGSALCTIASFGIGLVSGSIADQQQRIQIEETTKKCVDKEFKKRGM